MPSASVSARPRAAILAPGKLPPNVEAYLLNVANLVEGSVELELITDTPPAPAIADRYEVSLHRARLPSRGLRRLESLLWCIRDVRSRRPNVLSHVTDFDTYGSVVAVAAQLGAVRSVTRYTGEIFGSYRLQSNVLRRLRVFLLGNVFSQIALRRSGVIVAVGPRLAAQIVDRGVQPSRVRVLPQPIDKAVFAAKANKVEARHSLDLPINGRLVLFVGRLDWLKGVDVFEWLVPAAIERVPDLYFCFVGSGPYASRLAELPRSFVRAEVPHADVHHYFHAADLFLYPSRTDGLPTVILEALAAGLPVIARAVGDIPSVVDGPFSSDDELLGRLCAQPWPRQRFPDMAEPDQLRRAYIELLSGR